MAINQKPPIPRAFISAAGEDESGTKGQLITFPWGTFFRDLRADLDSTARVLPNGIVTISDGNASVAATTIFTPEADGLYSFQYAAAVNTVDGVSSSLTTAIDWTWGANTKTKSFTAMNGDATTTNDSGYWLFYATAASPIRYTLTYASNTAGQMHFSWYALVSSVSTGEAS
jgi:hypothetical protein